MKVRTSHVIFAVIVLLSAFMLLAVFYRSPAPKADTDEGFLEGVHELAATAPITQSVGTLPPAGADPSLVPVIELEPTPLVLTDVSNKDKTHAEVKVHNRGRATLNVTSVKSSCGCTQGEMDRSLIPPGETGILKVLVDPFRIYGFESEKTLTLYNNDRNNSAFELKVKTTIQPEFSIEPLDINFGGVERGHAAEATSILRPLQDELVGVERIELLGNLDMAVFSFEQRPEAEWTRPGFPEYLIHAKLNDHLTPGTHEQLYKVMLTCKRVPFLTCKASAVVSSFYSVDRMTVVLNAKSPDPPPVIMVRADRPFELTDVSVDTPDLRAFARPSPRPDVYELHVELNPGAKPGQNEAILLFTVKTQNQALVNRMPVQYSGK